MAPNSLISAPPEMFQPLLLSAHLAFAIRIAVPDGPEYHIAKDLFQENVEFAVYDPLPAVRVHLRVCETLPVAAIVLPTVFSNMSLTTSAHLALDVCKKVGVACLTVAGDAVRDAVAIAPPTEVQPHAVAAFVAQEAWKSVALLFMTEDEFLKMTTFVTDGHFVPFQSYFVRIAPFSNGSLDYSMPLKHVKDRLGLRSLVLAVEDQYVIPLLQTAASLDMCSNIFHYTIVAQKKPPSNYIKQIGECNVTVIVNDMPIARPNRKPRGKAVDCSGRPLESEGSWSWPTAHHSVSLLKREAGALSHFATYNNTRGEMTTTQRDVVEVRNFGKTLENRTLRVTVYMEAPFVMRKSDPTLQGNDAYDGYCIDLLKMIAGVLKFNYTIREVSDKSYGSKEANGKWNGMIGEIMKGTADLAVASLTISYSRSEVIDFTVPYMHLGISILFKRPSTSESNWSLFLAPLSREVWVSVFASYVVTSLSLWVIARISPFESVNEDSPQQNFTLANSFWFTVSSLMQQGSELSPRAASTRIVAAVWWFFTLIIISSYTANLAAFLTTQRMVTPIENADDLAAQSKIKYGTLGKGSTMSFFNESKIDTYERMWKLMSGQPGLFVSSSKEGIERVKSSDYAYLMESSMLEYAVERDCELMQVGGLLDQKGYGIGLPKGSPYRELLSTAILRLQEKTVLTELKEKWWKDKNTVCPQRRRKDNDSDSATGIFLLLLGGILVTSLLLILEIVIQRTKRRRCEDEQLPTGSELARHLLGMLHLRKMTATRTPDGVTGLKKRTSASPTPELVSTTRL